jgi:hypothetical protein
VDDVGDLVDFKAANPDYNAGTAGMVGQGIGLALSAFALSHSSFKELVEPVGDGETAPSQHAERRRVRLTIVANRNEVASVMRCENDDETVVDYGTAHGSLAVALNEVTRLMLA